MSNSAQVTLRRQGRITAPAFIVSLVTELVTWYEQEHGSNPLSYPSSTVEARILDSPGRSEGNLARSLVPTRQLPARLAVVERAMNLMPEDMRLAVLCRQLRMAKTFMTETGKSQTTYYALSDQGYWYISGVVQSAIDERVG